MVLKFMESSLDAFKDKLKNPFLGTLLLVWIVRNREFLFNLFFNENYNSEKRLVLLTQHFSGWTVVLNFLLTLCFSLLLLALIYLALNVSRFVVHFSETYLKPKILEIFDTNSIVSREEYGRVEAQRDYFEKRYSEERTEKLKLQKELDNHLTSKITGSVSTIDNTIIDGGTIEDEESKLKRVVESILDRGLSKEFDFLIQTINSNRNAADVKSEVGQQGINVFLRKNIIEVNRRSPRHEYQFTEFGKKIRDYYLNHFSN